MPLTVIVGGQFGSEGKGKVAKDFASHSGAKVAVRVGGPNSGHTAYDDAGKRFVFRHLPTAALLPEITCVLGAGTFIDVDVLLREIAACNLPSERLLIDPNATIISEADKQYEQDAGLRALVGSTLTGTGGALLRRIRRDATLDLAKNSEALQPFVQPVKPFLRTALDTGDRVILEGTQGYGLSLFHTHDYPYATSRDTTAASFVAEAGLSPLDVDEIVLVLRAFPIRVAGNSGPLPNEIDWETVTRESGKTSAIEELTTVTQVRRRVARFDCGVVCEAITVNHPTQIVLNHLDYIGNDSDLDQAPYFPVRRFIDKVEESIERKITHLGFDPYHIVPNVSSFSPAASGDSD